MNYRAMEWALRCQDGSTLDSKHNAPQVGDLVASFSDGDMYPMWIRRIVKVYTHKRAVSYTHLRAPRDGLLSRMPSSA